MSKHYVLEVTLREVTSATNIPLSAQGYPVRSEDRGKTVKVERDVTDKLKFIASTESLGEALQRVTDWAENEKKYLRASGAEVKQPT